MTNDQLKALMMMIYMSTLTAVDYVDLNKAIDGAMLVTERICCKFTTLDGDEDL